MTARRTLTIRVSDSDLSLIYTLVGRLSAREGRQVTQRDAVIYAVQAGLERLDE